MKIILGLLVCIIIFSPANYADTIGYWRFEEGTVNNNASGTGSILDEMGQNHGTPFNSVVYSDFTATNTIPYNNQSNNRSLYFDDRSGNSRVNLGNSLDFDITNEITLEAWFFPVNHNMDGDGATYDAILTKGGLWDTTSSYQLYYNTSAQNIRAVIRYGNDTYDHVNFAYSIARDQWIHAALTVDSSGSVKLYVNGALAGSANLPTGLTMLSNNREVWIGSASSSTASRGFTGYIDEIRILDEAITPDQFLITSNVPEPSYLLVLGISFIFVFIKNRNRS